MEESEVSAEATQRQDAQGAKDKVFAQLMGNWKV